jgi:hypothetical protein
MTVMVAPFPTAFMFLSAATVFTVPRRRRGFSMLDRTAGTAVTVAGVDGRDCCPSNSNPPSCRSLPCCPCSASQHMDRYFPALHALAARGVSTDPSLLHSAGHRHEPCP